MFFFITSWIVNEKIFGLQHVEVRTLFNKTRQLFIQILVKINNFLVCFCIFDLPCHILKKDTFIENVYIILSLLIK